MTSALRLAGVVKRFGATVALDGAGLTGKVAVVTDGHLSGLVNKTLLVCEVCPEAADGGPLALVEKGDVISIDVKKKVVDLHVGEEKLAERRARLQISSFPEKPGWLEIYKRIVKPLSDGAVLVD